jgi:hypothetical protein
MRGEEPGVWQGQGEREAQKLGHKGLGPGTEDVLMSTNKLPAMSLNGPVEEQHGKSLEPSQETQCREFERPVFRCLNPLCDKSVEPKRKHAPVKFYCSADCAQVVSLLKRVRKKLKDLSDEEIVRVIRSR